MEEKEMELSLDKVYSLPKFELVKYHEYYLAIAPNLAKWIVLENSEQLGILNALVDRASIQSILDKFNDNQEDVVKVLTQIEAKQLENTETKSVFLNTRLHLHLTNKCNLNCPHCYMKSGQPYDDELTTDEIKVLCNNFHNYGGTNVSITGGEPTIRNDFFEVVEYISSVGMEVSIFSNGYFWNEEKVNRLSRLNIEGIQISIDGYDDESNSVIRGKGVFDRALNAIDLFVKHNIYVKVAITAPYQIIKNQSNKYILFSKFLLDKYGNDAIEIDYSYFFMPGRELSSDKISAIKDEYYQIIDNVVKSVYVNNEEDAFVSNITGHIYDSCGYGGLNVMANGDFYFCDRIPDVSKSGNIRSMPFDKIYKLMKIAEEAGKIDNFKPCGSCELKYICGGGCRADQFRSFTNNNGITNIDFDKIPPRKCDLKDKERYYKLMIATNERFFF